MTIPDGYRAISPAPERSREFLHVDAFAFAFTIPEREWDQLAEIVPHGRTRAMEVADASRGDVGTLAAVHASFAYQTRVPGGGTVPTAGLTWVGVHPGHRRRGLLRAMINDHFERSIARGEAVSTLYAAETEIYQRFGYGHAAPNLGMELGRGVKLRDVEGADALTVVIDSADRAKHGPAIRSIQARMTRPGTVVEYTDDYEADLFMDLESDLSTQGEELRVVIIKDGDEPVGFSLLTRKGDWTPHGPDGKVHVRCWGALTTAAEHRLFSVLADFDLMSSTRVNKIAPDAPIVHLLQDMRSAKISMSDNLWLRVLDVAAALTARGYAADCDVAVAIADELVPANAGTWRITVADGSATVAKTDDAPDLSMPIQELGTVYLGGPTVVELWRAGLITEHTDGAAAQMSRAFASDLKPVANLNF